MERVDGAQARLKQRELLLDACWISLVERVDGAQARLKPPKLPGIALLPNCGKGGWGSGEIETFASHTLHLNQP